LSSAEFENELRFSLSDQVFLQ